MIYNTDKFDLGYINHIYNDLFNNRLNSTTKLLEIGVFRGGSALYWRDQFPNATIYAIDINKCDVLDNEPNICHIIGNAYTENITNMFDNDSLDIIIDDGPHTLQSFIYLLDHYLVKLKSGGLMVIEDIIDMSFTPALLDKLRSKQSIIPTKSTVYDMRSKQKTQQLLNRWQSGLDVLVIERL